MNTWPQYLLLTAVLSVGLSGSIGCRPNSDGLRIQSGIHATERQVQVDQVRAAAFPIFEKHLHPNQSIPSGDIPAIIASLPVFLGTPRTNIDGFVCDHGELMFMTGGGFGHWGIVISSNMSDVKPEEFDKNKLTIWSNGVFFFSEIRWK